MKASKTQINKFKKTVWDYYHQHGRHDLPWRKAITPYKIVVSEIMLQQTQVDRVVTYYRNWLKRFPSWKSLAHATVPEVLERWMGLGYNRRGLYLQKLAQVVVQEHGGKLPADEAVLRQLPGIGPYTAAAVAGFAYGKASLPVETNIRTVVIHHFFADQQNISEQQIEDILQQCLAGVDDVRQWYWALMDYGSHLKKTVGNLNKQSKTYQKQSTFAGSNRQARAAVLRRLQEGPATVAVLVKVVERDKDLVQQLLTSLAAEGFVEKQGRGWRLLQ